jgi:hypothetical protein
MAVSFKAVTVKINVQVVLFDKSRTVIAEPEGSKPLMPKSADRHDVYPIPST